MINLSPKKKQIRAPYFNQHPNRTLNMCCMFLIYLYNTYRLTKYHIKLRFLRFHVRIIYVCAGSLVSSLAPFKCVPTHAHTHAVIMMDRNFDK